MRGWCCRCMASCVLIMTAAFAAPAAFSQTTYTFNLPEQPLADSLRAIGQQTEMNILFEPDAVKSVRSPALRGSFTADDAIRWVLKGTKLEVQHTTATNVVVKFKSATSTAQPTTSVGSAPSPGTRIAQSDMGGQSQSNIDGPQNTNASSAEPGSEKDKLSEIVVTGSHLRGEAPIGSELIVIGRDDIEKSGYGRVEDLFTTVTQNYSFTNESFNQVVSNDNHGAAIDLRGLGPGTTLTLVNGVRQPAGGSVGAFVDISNIPTSAIERIEILPDGASAIYGSDAIGGVVNIILRNDFRGAETSVRFGKGDGGADETQISQLFGTTWSTGNVMVGLQYYDRTDLPCSASA
jgi:iron complex outermembrane receptor protein